MLRRPARPAHEQESSYFPERFTGRDVDDHKLDTIAWWALDRSVDWTLGRAVAETLVTAFNAK